MITADKLLELYTKYIDALHAFDRGGITGAEYDDAAMNFSEAADNATDDVLREFEDRR